MDEIVDFDDETIVLEKEVKKIIDDVIKTEEDDFMNILVAVQKYRQHNHDTIKLKLIDEPTYSKKYIQYASNLNKIINHLITIPKTNENYLTLNMISDGLSDGECIMRMSEDTPILVKYINDYIQTLNKFNKEKNIIETEICIISSIISNMYDEILCIITKNIISEDTYINEEDDLIYSDEE